MRIGKSGTVYELVNLHITHFHLFSIIEYFFPWFLEARIFTSIHYSKCISTEKGQKFVRKPFDYSEKFFFLHIL
jgi:hypothetical protein